MKILPPRKFLAISTGVLVALLMVVAIVLRLNLHAAYAQSKSSASTMTPLQMMQSGRYTQALPYFKSMAQAQPRDMSVQYYLGTCAEGARDYNLAVASFCKVVVDSLPESAFAQNARKRLESLPDHLRPQCCIQNNKTHRWDPKAYPIRVFISDGRDLPPEQSGGVMSQANYKQAQTIIQNSLSRQLVTPSYKSVYARYVSEGIKAWDWAVREKLFSYVYVTDPRKADIVVLFCERCKGSEAGFALYPWEWKQPEILWMACEYQNDREPADAQRTMTAIAAHEFGHCLGLEHTDVTTDLMYPTAGQENGNATVLPESLAKPNDRASLRALYSMPADVNFIPVE